MANIRKISDNSYKITVSCGRDANNKQIRHYMTWKPDRPMTEKQMEKAVQKAAFEFERQIELGFRPDNNQTFKEYAEYFIELKKAQGVVAGTLRNYEWVKQRVYAGIGDMKLSDIRPYHLNKLYAKIAEPGGRINRKYCYPQVELRPFVNKLGGVNRMYREIGIDTEIITRACRGERLTQSAGVRLSAALGLDFVEAFRIEENENVLTNTMIERHHVFVQMVLDEAEKDMLITYNPARRATVPKHKEEKKVKCLQPEDVNAVLKALENEDIRTKAVIYTLMYTGMRRGELCALKWSKVDFKKNRVLIDAGVTYTKETGTVYGQTKTGNVRYISIPPALVTMLKEYRKWYTLERFRLCGAWENNDYIFCRRLGAVMAPTDVNLLVSRFCEAHELPHIHPHQFRHTAASLMIASGTDVVTVADVLGHKTTTTTLSVYAHAIDTAKEKAANTMESAIKSCKTG